MVEDLSSRKQSHINALYSNSGYEGKEGAQARADIIEKLEKEHEDAIAMVYGEYEEEEIDMNDPFFAHAYDGLPPLTEENKD